MEQSIVKMNKTDKLFLTSILENGNKSDAQIAREIGVSKATANRVRKSLEKRKIIQGYTPVIDLDVIGIDMFMAVLFQWKQYKDEKLTQSMLSDLEKDARVAFFACGDGSGFTHIIFFGFNNLPEAHFHFNKFREKYETGMGNMISFFIPSSEIKKQDYTDVIRAFITNDKVKEK